MDEMIGGIEGRGVDLGFNILLVDWKGKIL